MCFKQYEDKRAEVKEMNNRYGWASSLHFFFFFWFGSGWCSLLLHCSSHFLCEAFFSSQLENVGQFFSKKQLIALRLHAWVRDGWSVLRKRGEEYEEMDRFSHKEEEDDTDRRKILVVGQPVFTDVRRWRSQESQMFCLVPVFLPQFTHWNMHDAGTQGQNKGFGVLTQILKAQLLDLPGLPTLISLLSPCLCHLPSASTPPSLPPSSIPSLSLLISFYLRLPPSLFHNSLSHYNSLYSINCFSPYFTVPSLHRLLLINHPIYLSLSVKVSACYSPSLLSQAVYVSQAARIWCCYVALLPAQICSHVKTTRF